MTTNQNPLPSLSDVFHPIIPRMEASKRDLNFYFTGKACKHGHVSRRNTKSRDCVDCSKIRWLKGSRKKRSNPIYRLKENERSRRKLAFLRANDPAYVAKKNGHNRIYAARRRLDPIYAEQSRQAIRDLYAREDGNYRFSRKSYFRTWYQNNKELCRNLAANRRALERGAAGVFSKEDVIRINDRQEHKCVYCDACTKYVFHVDHIVALARGGSNWPSNLQILCPGCNTSKKAKSDAEFREMRLRDRSARLSASR